MGDGKAETQASAPEKANMFGLLRRKRKDQTAEQTAQTLVDHINASREKVDHLIILKENDIKNEKGLEGINREKKRIFLEIDRHLESIVELCDDYQHLEK